MSAPVLAATAAPHKVTLSPIVTGTTVLGIKYADGVMMIADTLGSYGNLARYTDLRRIRRVGDYTLIGASGEYSDFQFIMDNLHELVLAEHVADDDAKLSAPEIHSYLSRMMYNRRNKQNPLWNKLLVAGVKKAAAALPAAAGAASSASSTAAAPSGAAGEPFLGYVDLIGTCFVDNYIATGYGLHMALPLIRDRWRAGMTEGEARALLEDCMRVLWYRDCRALNKLTLAKITAEGAVISEPYVLETKWDYRSFRVPKASADTGGSW